MQAGRSRVLQFRLQTSPEQWEQNVAGRAIDDITVEATNTIRPVEKITIEGGTWVDFTIEGRTIDDITMKTMQTTRQVEDSTVKGSNK